MIYYSILSYNPVRGRASMGSSSRRKRAPRWPSRCSIAMFSYQ